MAPQRKKSARPDCCDNEAPLPEDTLITHGQAVELMGLFKVLANDTRVRMLQALAMAGEMCVGSLAKALDMKSQAVSNQLQRLTDRGIVRPRRQGTTIYYRIINPCITELLDRARCFVGEGCSGP